MTPILQCKLPFLLLCILKIVHECVHGWAHLVMFWAKSEAQEAAHSLVHPNSLEVTHL